MRRTVVDRRLPTSMSRAVVSLLALTLSVELVLSGVSYLLSGMLHEGVVEQTLSTLAFLLAVPGGVFTAWAFLAFGLLGLVSTWSLVGGNADTTERRGDRAGGEQVVESDPVGVLQRRYADGEVTDEEFEEQLTRLLRSGEESDSSPENAETNELVE
ncbi:hypothetical protein AUR64_08045 [Haloprofundus marisrubri]|uniref:SHOCT domain-containing protein n=1 Tax=Haloprofundus marisrubri TaxID=1514971 RepID=A0A0W1RBI3_9EURY|nr:SHOCT domain-containing protein [Haloprofundus marisrubri]KTG10608.1 hypothetical protein AUR64_08045 [Haloprofundus marisrubri]